MNDEIKIIADQLMQSGMEMDSAIDEAIRLFRQSTEEDLRLQDLEDQVMGRSRPYKRGERMLRLLDPSQDPLTGERNIRDFGRQKIANIIPGMTLIGREKVFQGHNPLYNLLQEANRVSKAYHGQDYLKELHHRVMQAGRGRVDKDFGYESSFADGGQVFASDTDKIAQKLIEQGLDRETAMAAALRMAQSRQQANESILGGVPTQPPVSDVPPATEILGGDPSRLFQRQPTTMERIRDLPKDVLGAGEALVSMGSLAALAPASMLYALRPGQKTQGDPMEFALKNMYMPRSERGPSHLAGLGEVLESFPQTGPLPELQAFSGVGRGVGRHLTQKARQAGEAMAPKAADIAENILSRQGLLMQAAPSGPTRVEAPASPLGFYDPVHQAALNIQRKQGPGQAFLNELQRSENVNKEFLEASGLAEKLRTTPNITREEVQNLAKGAVPEIQEVVKGQKGYQEAKVIAAQDIGETIQAGLGYFDDDHQALLNRWRSSPRGSAEERQAASTLEALLRQSGENRGVNDYIDAGAAQTVNTKYAQYQLPGGENYREVLLTMPSKQERDFAWEWFDPATQQSKQFATRDAALLDKPLGAIVQKVETAERNKDYKSAHWEEPNVVSHIRMNDRTDAEGKKVLFIEEIQSDWAQEGRKKGFQTNDLKIDGKTAEEWQNEAVRLFESMPDVPSPEQTSAMNAASRNARELRDRARSQGLKDGQQVPVAPFVQNTKEWVDLSLKNIIKRAVDEGYDRVAFINGTQSADRYDLSKHIDSVNAAKHPSMDGYHLTVKDKNGNKITDRAYGTRELPDVVGKELADKIIQNNGGNFTGLDLKVGGEGMKAFYDKLVPERVNAILKRFGGGKLGEVGVRIEAGAGNDPLHDYHFDARDNQFVVDRVDNNGVSEVGRFPDRASAATAVDRLNMESATPRMQPGFDITPAMRERFQKPIPYKQGGSVNHKAVASARRALEKAMAKGGEVKMGTGGSMLGTVAGKAAAAGKKSTQWAQEAAAAKRAPAKSKEEIEAIARRMAAQTQPGFVRASEEQSINPAGKSQLLYEMEQRTPMVVESTIADRPVPNVDYEQQLGKVIVGVPGDPTMGQVAVPGSLESPTRGGKQLVQVGDVRPETPVQLYGGPQYGANLDETFWASNLSPARAVQNLVQEMAQKYGAEQVLGKYIKMSPESSRFAMHNLDALISVLQPEKLDKDKVELLNNLVRKGNPKNKFPEFAGFEDPINVLLQAQMNSKLRKQISEVLEKPSVAKQVGFPFPGKVVQTAITEPELRNVETGVTGFAIGKMNPKGKLSFSSHPTYDYDIPGQAIGRSKYLIPSEMSFPDFTAWYRSRPDVQAKVDPINMMKSYGPRQVIDQQYIDEIKMYEEAMKQLTGRKKGGAVKMAGGGALSKAAAAAAKNSKSLREPILINPKSLTFRESDQNRLQEVRNLFPKDTPMNPIVAIQESDGSLVILDGHNRAVVAAERKQKLPMVSVTRQEYEDLTNRGFDDMEISFAALTRTKQDEAASDLNRQFPGADVGGRGMSAWMNLPDVEEAPVVSGAVKSTDITKRKGGKVGGLSALRK